MADRCTTADSPVSSIPVNHILKRPSCVLSVRYRNNTPQTVLIRTPCDTCITSRYTPHTTGISYWQTHPLTIVKITSS